MGVWKLLTRKVAGGVGKAIEKALFGDLDEDEVDARTEKAPPDPFAKLKAAEAEKAKREPEKK